MSKRTKRTGRRRRELSTRRLAAISQSEIAEVVQAVNMAILALDAIAPALAKLSVAIDLMKANAAALQRGRKPIEGPEEAKKPV